MICLDAIWEAHQARRQKSYTKPKLSRRYCARCMDHGTISRPRMRVRQPETAKLRVVWTRLGAESCLSFQHIFKPPHDSSKEAQLRRRLRDAVRGKTMKSRTSGQYLLSHSAQGQLGGPPIPIIFARAAAECHLIELGLSAIL